MIPAELQGLPNWVLWRVEDRGGKPTKVPYSLAGFPASTTDPKTWSAYSAASEKYEEDPFGWSGLGCVIVPPYVGVDLDKCREPETGVVEKWALDAIAELGSYTELSPSGRGFHIWAVGAVPEGGNRRGGVEMYDRARYFTMTGDHVPGTPEGIRRVELSAFHAKYILAGDGRDKAPVMPRDESPSAKEFKLCLDLWRRFGKDATEKEIAEAFFKKAEYREKWDRNRTYVLRTIRNARAKAFDLPSPVEIEDCLSATPFSEIVAKPVEWLWLNRIPKGKLTVFGGDPDVGKTTVLCDLIARYTKGAEWPDGAAGAPAGEVLFLSSEDDPADTLKPRLMAAGADVARVHYVSGVRVTEKSKRVEREMALDTDLLVLEAHLRDNPKIGLIAIDPFTSYVGRADVNKEQDLRRVLGRLKSMAERTGVAFVTLGHFSKRGDVRALHKLGGSVALTGTARAVWGFLSNPEKPGEYLMLLAKGNLTRKRDGLVYRIGEGQTEVGGQPVIEWGEASQRNLDAVVDAGKDSEVRKKAQAERFLIDALASGPRPSEELIREAKEKVGIGRTNLFAAKKELGVKAVKRADGWWWGKNSPTARGEESGEDEF